MVRVIAATHSTDRLSANKTSLRTLNDRCNAAFMALVSSNTYQSGDLVGRLPTESKSSHRTTEEFIAARVYGGALRQGLMALLGMQQSMSWTVAMRGQPGEVHGMSFEIHFASHSFLFSSVVTMCSYCTQPLATHLSPTSPQSGAHKRR